MMSPLERWLLRLGALSAVATGLGLGLLRSFGTVEGEFGPEPSPHLAAWQHSHVLAVPLLVLALGAALAGHAKGALANGPTRSRRSGLSLGAVALPLILGGPLIQVMTDAGARAWVGWVHAGLGALFVLTYLVHWAKRLGAREPAPAPGPTTRGKRIARVAPTGIRTSAGKEPSS